MVLSKFSTLFSDEVRISAIGRGVRHRYLFKKRWKRAAVGILDNLGMVGVFLRRIFKTNTPLNPQKILVVRIDSLGDAVLTLPAIQTLARRFPKSQIDFLANPPAGELYSLFFPESEIILFERNWLSGEESLGKLMREFFSMIRKLRASHYDLGIDFRGDLRTLVLLSLAKIPHRWGRDGTGGRFLLTHRLKNPYEKHEILENLALVQGKAQASLRVNEMSEAISDLRLLRRPCGTPRNDDKEALGRLGSGKKIVIHVGAGYPSKRWAASNFVKLAKRIQERGLGTPVFIGSSEEKILLDPYRGELGDDFWDLTGKTSLSDLLTLLSQADLYIGNDSGPAHLAALLDLKIVLIFSGTNDFKRWAPWSSQLQLVHHPVPCSPCEERICPLSRQLCLEDISVEEVFCVVEKALSS